jgi:hypothetical protein
MKKLFLILSLIIGILSCTKEESKNTEMPKSVYVLETEKVQEPSVNQNGVYNVNLIKDGKVISSYKNEHSGSLATSETDIYTLTYNEYSSTLRKNDKAIDLYKNLSPFFVSNSFFVANSSVYIPITTFKNNIAIASLWRDGVITNLSNGIKNTYSRSVFVEGNDVYYIANQFISGDYNFFVWKNGIQIYESGSKSYADKIIILKSDVYIIGDIIEDGKRYATIWKNGIKKFLNEDAEISYLMDIFLSNKDVYIVGQKTNKGKSVATLWKNEIALSLSDGNSNSYANAIYVDGNDVYVAGSENDFPKLWKNGVLVSLATTNKGSLTDVFIR